MLTSWKKKEREQIPKRIAQLQRRDVDSRIFIAFVGEKKAGKSSLLKMITGVPLPTAVRECTAAVCLIQLGLDWHHMATLRDGEKTDFQTIDNSREQRILRLARRKDKLAAETSLKTIQQAELDLNIASEELDIAKDGKESSCSSEHKRESTSSCYFFFTVFLVDSSKVCVAHSSNSKTRRRSRA